MTLNAEYILDVLALAAALFGVFGEARKKDVPGFRGIKPLGWGVMVVALAVCFFSIRKDCKKQKEDEIAQKEAKTATADLAESQRKAIGYLTDANSARSAQIALADQERSARLKIAAGELRESISNSFCGIATIYTDKNFITRTPKYKDLGTPEFLKYLKERDLSRPLNFGLRANGFAQNDRLVDIVNYEDQRGLNLLRSTLNAQDSFLPDSLADRLYNFRRSAQEILVINAPKFPPGHEMKFYIIEDTDIEQKYIALLREGRNLSKLVSNLGPRVEKEHQDEVSCNDIPREKLEN